MVKEKIKVEAKDEQEAIEQACIEFKERLKDEFSQENITLNLVENKKKLFGLLGSKKIYEVVLELDDGVDGSFQIKVKDDGIFLEVYQPQGRGRDVRMDMIEEVIEEKELVEVNYTAVSEALTQDGEEVKIAERRPELDYDAELKLDIKADKMEAYLSYTPPLGGVSFTVEDIFEKVREEGIIFGIQEKELKEVFDPSQPLESFLIAVGKEPTPGEDGKINFEFNIHQEEKKVNLLEDGSADFYNLDRIVNVKPGEVLATKDLPVEGNHGKNIEGEPIPPEPVESIEFPVGENVKISEDGLTLIADMEGQAVYTQQAISVLEVYTVNGDVDLSTGNINFKGNVVINGDVTDGMKVKAKGNVSITGSVYGANIEAEGQIVIKKGFIGSNRGELTAKGDIEVKFIETGIVITEGDLIVQDAIMHSKVDVGQKIILNQGKGLIVGGEVRAAKEIDAKIIGSNLATPTKVYVGITPEIRDKFEEKNNQFKTKQKKLDQVLKNIKLLKNKREDQNGRLSSEKQQLLNQLIRKRFSIVSEIEELKAERKVLSKKIEEGKEGVIKVKGIIHSGVMLTVGTCICRIDQEKDYIQYYVEEEEIKSKPYS